MSYNNNPQQQGASITGVSGAQHARQKNAQAIQRVGQQAGAAGAAGAAGQANFEIGQVGQGSAQLQGANITGVSGAQHARQKNAQSLQQGGQPRQQ